MFTDIFKMNFLVILLLAAHFKDLTLYVANNNKHEAASISSITVVEWSFERLRVDFEE